MSGSRRVRFGVNAFHNGVRDLIESVKPGMVANSAQLEALLVREGLDPSFRPVLGRLLFTYKNINDAATRGLEADGDVAIAKSLTVGGAYTYLEAEDTVTGLALTGRHRHHGHVRGAWRHDGSGFRANLRGTFYSSWIAARATSAARVTDTIAPAFMLWDTFAAQRLTLGLSAFVAIDNVFASQDPNTGVLSAAGTPAAIDRPDIGRTARFGVRWSWSAR